MMDGKWATDATLYPWQMALQKDREASPRLILPMRSSWLRIDASAPEYCAGGSDGDDLPRAGNSRFLSSRDRALSESERAAREASFARGEWYLVLPRVDMALGLPGTDIYLHIEVTGQYSVMSDDANEGIRARAREDCETRAIAGLVALGFSDAELRDAREEGRLFEKVEKNWQQGQFLP